MQYHHFFKEYHLSKFLKKYLWSQGYDINMLKVYKVFYWSILSPIGFKMLLQSGAFLSQLVPIFTVIISIPYNTDFVVRFEFLRNRAWGTCEGVLTVWHVSTICKQVQVERLEHVVISSCKPRKQLNFVSVFHNYIKHISRAIWIIHPVQPVKACSRVLFITFI